MKIKTFILFIVLFVGSLIVISKFTINKGYAAGSGELFATITSSSNTPTIGQAITLNIHAFDVFCIAAQFENSYYSETPNCNPGYTYTEEHPNWTMSISVSGSDNNLSSSIFIPNSTGDAQVTLSSSVAETKTVSVNNNGGTIGTTTITYITPASTSTSTSTPTSTPTSPPTSSPVVNPPATPSSDSIKVDGHTITADQKVTVKQDKSLTLSGKTVPNGLVALYVFSEPKKYSVTADKDGNWSYEVKGLEPGEHHIEAEVSDPVTGKTSARGQLLAFSVTQATAAKSGAATGTGTSAAKKSSLLPYILAGIASLLVLISLYLCFFQKNFLRKLFGRSNTTPPVS